MRGFTSPVKTVEIDGIDEETLESRYCTLGGNAPRYLVRMDLKRIQESLKRQSWMAGCFSITT